MSAETAKLVKSPSSLTANQRARRSRILKAARELVAQKGYEGTIMRDVANAANVSPTTLYNLYNTKDELLLEALRQSVTDGWQRTEQEVPSLGFDRLLEQMHQSALETHQAPAYAKAITQALFRANANDQIVTVLVNDGARAVRGSLREMQDHDQLIANTDLYQLSTAMVGGFWATYFLWATQVIDLQQLEGELKRGYLCQLLPVVQGPIKQRIVSELASLTNN